MAEQKEIRLLRLFAENKQARQKALEEFVQNGKIEVLEGEKNDETLVQITSCAESTAAATVILDHCQDRVAQACGAALYGVGEWNLYRVLVEIMLRKNMLFVPADERVRSMWERPLSNVENAGAVYDFGGCSCADAKSGKKIEQAAKKEAFPLAAAQARITTACRVTQADWAAACFETDGEPMTVLVGNEKGCWAYTLKEGQRPVLWITDILRRAALGYRQADGVLWIKAGNTAGADEKAEKRSNPFHVLGFTFAMVFVATVAVWGIAHAVTDGKINELWNIVG